jgi:predicted DNA-binding protein
MPKTKAINNSIKYTVVMPESSVEQLKELAGKNIISSVNAGVREAVEDYLIKVRKELYKKDLQEAVKDPEFIKRSEETMQAFKNLDQDAEGMIPEW